MFPGLLQTTDYARMIMYNTGLWDDEQIERLAQVRSSRLDNIGQRRLTCVLDEAVVRKVAGKREILQAQLDSVLVLVEQGRVRVLAIPNHAPLHPNPPSPFRVMVLGDGRLIAHEEYWTGNNITTGPRVNQFVTLFGNLQSEALNLQASVQLIEHVRKEV